MSSLEIDIDYGKKKETGGKKEIFIDRRKIRAQQSFEEKVIKNIKDSFEKLGYYHTQNLEKEIIKIKNIEKLNKILICLVYKYFESKNFDIELVLQNFNEDFEEQLNILSKFNLFQSKLKSEINIYNFRKDFCCYLFIIYDFINKQD